MQARFNMETDQIPQNAISRANVLGVGIHSVSLKQAVSDCVRLVKNDGKGYVCATGVHGIIEAQDNPLLRRILNQAFLNLADGMPTVWMGRLQGLRRMHTIRGPEFMLSLCEASVGGQLRHFLYGGAEGVVDKLERELKSRFPGIQIVGAFTPPFRPLNEIEKQALLEQVQMCTPDIFWVGLSTPKQELFIGEHLQVLPVKLMIAVGAAFDFHSGRKKDAPVWVKDIGLHWLYRIFQEPRRLLPRYGIVIPRFLFLALLQLLGARRMPLPRPAVE